MSGWGLRDQWEATRHFKRKMWRDSSFLHQLSENGSLLLDQNHDRLYMAKLSQLLGFKKRIPWDLAAEMLLKLPAHQARRILWLASYRWWHESYRRRMAIIVAFVRTGHVKFLLEDPNMAANLDDLKLRAKQLKNLSWCYEDTTPTFEPIPVVERDADGRKRVRRRKVRV